MKTFRFLSVLPRSPSDGGGVPAGGDHPAGGAPEGGQPAPGAAPASWDAALPPEQRQLVTTKGWKSPADVLASYAQLEGTLGRDKVALPGKDAKPEDWASVWNKLGRPEKPEGYDLSGFKAPDGMPWNADAQQAMVSRLHGLGLTQQQLAGAFQAYAEIQGGAFQGMQQATAQAAETATAELRREWGAGYDANIELANRAVKAAFGDKLDDAKQMRLADGTFLLDNPVIARAFASLGGRMAEDADLAGARGGGGANAVRTPDQAKAEIQRIRSAAASDPKHAYVDPSHPEHKALQARMNELYALAAGGGSGARD